MSGAGARSSAIGSGTSSRTSLPGRDDRVRTNRHAVDGQPPVGDELLDVAPGQARRVGHEPVDPAGGPVGDPHGPDARRDRRFRHPASPAPAGRSSRSVTNALTNNSRMAQADRRIGDVERVQPEVADADIDEVDDVADAEPVGHVAERATEQQPERHGQTACSGPRCGGTRRSRRRRRPRRPRTAAPDRGTARRARRCSANG